VLTGWLAAQTNLQTWEADVVETRSLKTLTQPLSATGHIWFAKPNRFRWQIGSPPRTIAFRDRDELWLIYPLLKRAERYPLASRSVSQWREMLDLLESGFPRDREELASRFRITSLSESNGSWVLALEPRADFVRQFLKEIRVGLSTDEFSLTSDELVLSDGSRVRDQFRNARINPELDPELFVWKPEPSYSVTEPLKK
jgi:outer membrane lipoprotein-sorting protein